METEMIEHPYPSDKFPVRNRVPALKDRLPMLKIEVVSAEGSRLEGVNETVVALIYQQWPLTPIPGEISDISGEPAVIYRTWPDLELRLTPAELRRMALLNFSPDEFFVLAKKYGIAFEWHDDFYDEDSGEALQPHDEPGLEDCIRFLLSSAGEQTALSTAEWAIFELGKELGGTAKQIADAIINAR
jgi:hypothetical protein